MDAFVRGDYARVRREGRELARQTTDEGVHRAIETLIERTKPDRLSLALLALAAALLVALSAWWITHGKSPPGAHPDVEHAR